MKNYPAFGLAKLNKLIRVPIELGGEFQLRRLDGVTREVIEETPWTHNLVLDIGLDRFGSGLTHCSHCRIGTGTAAPANGDTALQSQSASTSNALTNSGSNAGASTYASTTTTVWEFALGAVVGNMAEVGVGWSASTASTLFSRARINDAGGSPTTITVLVTEILQVSYRFTIYPQVTDVTGNVTISGNVHAYTSRCYNAANLIQVSANGVFLVGTLNVIATNGTINGITSSGASGTQATITGGALQAYTNGNYYRDFTVSANISQGNLSGGIQSMNILMNGAITSTQIGFVPNILKDGTNVLNLTFRYTWARH